MVPADSTGISPVPAYSGYPPPYSCSPYGTLTPCGAPSQTLQVTFIQIMRVLLPPDGLDRQGLGCSAFARHYSRNHSCFLFLRLLRCFSSAGQPPFLDILTKSGRVAPFGHPRIGPPCGSPWLFAAWHVLLRLQEPRHPPCALVHLHLTYGPLLLRPYAVNRQT